MPWSQTLNPLNQAAYGEQAESVRPSSEDTVRRGLRGEREGNWAEEPQRSQIQRVLLFSWYKESSPQHFGKNKIHPPIFPGKISRQKSHPPGRPQPGLHTSSGSWTKRTHLCSNILAFVFNYLLTSPNAKYIIKQTQHRATSFEYVFVSFLVSDCLFICIYYSSKRWYLKLHVKRLNVNSYLSKRNSRILNFLKNPTTI